MNELRIGGMSTNLHVCTYFVLAGCQPTYMSVSTLYWRDVNQPTCLYVLCIGGCQPKVTDILLSQASHVTLLCKSEQIFNKLTVQIDYLRNEILPTL